jgi:hypothetical protein
VTWVPETVQFCRRPGRGNFKGCLIADPLALLFGPTRRYPCRFGGARLLATGGSFGELGPSCCGSAATISDVRQGRRFAILALLLGAVDVELQGVGASHPPELLSVALGLLGSFSGP